MEPQRSAPRPSSRDRFGMNSLSRKGFHDQIPEPCSILRLVSSMVRHSISRCLRFCISTVTPGVTPSVWIEAGRFGPLDARHALRSPASPLVYHQSSRIICLLLYYGFNSFTSPRTSHSSSPLIYIGGPTFQVVQHLIGCKYSTGISSHKRHSLFQAGTRVRF